MLSSIKKGGRTTKGGTPAGVGEWMCSTRITEPDAQDIHISCVKLNPWFTFWDPGMNVSLPHSRGISLFHPPIRFLWVFCFPFYFSPDHYFYEILAMPICSVHCRAFCICLLSVAENSEFVIILKTLIPIKIVNSWTWCLTKHLAQSSKMVKFV